MGRHKSKFGICKLCGKEGKLSFEHVPPKRAFNNNGGYFEAAMEDIMKLELNEDLEYPIQFQSVAKQKQGGIGTYSLCQKCNNDTGSWYADDFISWAHQSMTIILKSKGKPTLSYPTFFYPLRVIKQVITMFFSINGDHFKDDHPDLVKFILNKEEWFLDNKYQLYCYYNIIGRERYIGQTFVGNGSTVNNLCEFTFPPFGFVLAIDSTSPDRRLTNITHFTNFRYSQWTDYFQAFETLPTFLSFVPGDYRSKKEISQAIREGKKHERM